MTTIFHSSDFKIKRALTHFNNFQTVWSAFAKSGPCTFIQEENLETGERIHKLKLTREMPESITGDAYDSIQNLRSALDLAISAVARAHGISDYRRYFPIAQDLAKSEITLKGKEFVAFPPEIPALLAKFKPYQGGNDLLWALKVAADTNKHGIVHPAGLASGGFNFVNANFRGGMTLTTSAWDSTKNEMELFREPVSAKNDFRLDHTLHIVFGDIEFLRDRPAELVLFQFGNMVEVIVRTIEKECRRIGLTVDL